MSAVYTVSIDELVKEFSLEVTFRPERFENILIKNTNLNRPGLQLCGFYDYFDNQRIQILGRVEHTYMETLESSDRLKAFRELFSRDIPCIIMTRSMKPFSEMIEAAREFDIPIMQSHESSSDLMSSIIAYLNVQLAPRVTRHGVMVEVYGEGILLLGESGVGKSETAMELLKRGHRLIADDAVEIKRVSSKTLVGIAPENIRHFIELRGVGIIDVRRIYGMGAIKITEKVDMIIHLELWDETKQYERLGIDTEYSEILGIEVPFLKIPVKPGRNLAVIIEVAAMNNRQKKLGYNSAQELFNGLSLSQ